MSKRPHVDVNTYGEDTDAEGEGAGGVALERRLRQENELLGRCLRDAKGRVLAADSVIARLETANKRLEAENAKLKQTLRDLRGEGDGPANLKGLMDPAHADPLYPKGVVRDDAWKGASVQYASCTQAAEAGDLDELKKMRDLGFFWDAWTCCAAAKGGHVQVLKYAHEGGCPWNSWTCLEAAKAGHLDALRYAHQNQCPWDAMTCQSAARYGHFEVFKYAHENGCPWDEELTCKVAARHGYIDVIQYAHENGCPWGEGTCEAAAEGGHLNVLKYAVAQGCPWNKEACLDVLARQVPATSIPSHTHIAEWIRAN